MRGPLEITSLFSSFFFPSIILFHHPSYIRRAGRPFPAAGSPCCCDPFGNFHPYRNPSKRPPFASLLPSFRFKLLVCPSYLRPFLIPLDETDGSPNVNLLLPLLFFLGTPTPRHLTRSRPPAKADLQDHLSSSSPPLGNTSAIAGPLSASFCAASKLHRHVLGCRPIFPAP